MDYDEETDEDLMYEQQKEQFAEKFEDKQIIRTESSEQDVHLKMPEKQFAEEITTIQPENIVQESLLKSSSRPIQTASTVETLPSKGKTKASLMPEKEQETNSRYLRNRGNQVSSCLTCKTIAQQY